MPTTPTIAPRFQKALLDNEPRLLRQLAQSRIQRLKLQLFIWAFKAEQTLEVWIRNREDQRWQYFKSYPFCRTSGTLGPKRKAGDRQIPEGIYYIDRFNPQSKYHLSLGLNYPNASDLILGDPQAPGSDIFLHGGCETVGCIPITDAGIEELYILATWAKENEQDEIMVHIFPFQFTNETWVIHQKSYQQHLHLWRQLNRVYSAFEKEKILPKITIGSNGEYDIIH